VTVTAIGPFLLALALYVLAICPDRLPFLIVFFAPFSATAVVNLTAVGYKSGAVGVTPAILFALCYFGSQFGLGRATRSVVVSSGLVIQIYLIIIFVFTVIISGALSEITGGMPAFKLAQTVYVLLGVAATITLSFEFCRPGAIDRALTAARSAAVFTSLWGFLQVVCFYTGIPYPSFIFNNSMSDFADMFDQHGTDYIRIASVAVEPSFFAASLLHFLAFGATILVCEPRLRTRGWIASVTLSGLAIICSTSSTGYVGLAVLAVLLLIRFPMQSVSLGAIAVVPLLLACLTFFPKLTEHIESATIYKDQSRSYQDRMGAVSESFQVFSNHPIFGAGWGSGPNFSAISTMLADIGLIGTTIFLIACLATLFELECRRAVSINGSDWRLVAYASGVQNALIVAFACAVTSGIKFVMMDDWCFWALGIAIASRLPGRIQASDQKSV